MRFVWVVAFALSALPAAAGDEWHVMPNETNAWAYNKGGAWKDESTGFMLAQTGWFHGTPKTDGAVTYSFDMRTYRVDCAKGRVQLRVNERFTDAGLRVGGEKPADPKPFLATIGYPKLVRDAVCIGVGLEGAIKAPSKAAAMALMMRLAQAAQAPAAAKTTLAAAATLSNLNDKFCKDMRSILSQGLKEKPAFDSFYLSADERKLFAGRASTPIEGFGECRINGTSFRSSEPGRLFATYYCVKTGLSEAESRAFATATSKRVSTCLGVGYSNEGDEGRTVVKSYDHSMEMMGTPVVRVVIKNDYSVVIHLDAKGR